MAVPSGGGTRVMAAPGNPQMDEEEEQLRLYGLATDPKQWRRRSIAAKPPRKKRAVKIERVSIQEKRKESRGTLGHSINTQDQVLDETIQRMGYEIASEYGASYLVGRVPTVKPKRGKRYPGAFIDDGGPSWALSAGLRPALWEFILGVHEGRINVDAVFVYEPGRMARDPETFGKIFRLITKGLKLELVIEGRVLTDRDLQGINHRLEGQINDVLLTREKTVDTLRHLKENGQALGRPPIGLIRKRDGDGKGFEVDPKVQFVLDAHEGGTRREEIAQMFPPYVAPGARMPRKLSRGGIDRIIRNAKALEDGTLESVLAEHRPSRNARLDLYAKLELEGREEVDTWIKENYPKVVYRLN